MRNSALKALVLKLESKSISKIMENENCSIDAAKKIHENHKRTAKSIRNKFSRIKEIDNLIDDDCNCTRL